MNIPVENTFDPCLFIKNFSDENFDDCIGTIDYTNGLDFKYINFQNIDLTNSIITSQEIFNFNFFLIVSKLSDYFPNTNINLSYGKSNRNELVLKDIDSAIKHDIYIGFKQDDKYFECGFDFIKKTFNVVQSRYISSIVNLDYYRYFDEDYDSIDMFMEDCIYRLLIIICALANDEFELAKILFIKSNTNIPDLQDQLEIYKKIIGGKKNKYVNFYEFYEELMPVNPETGLDMEYNEFIKYVENNIFDGIQLKFVDENMIYWDDFDLVLLCLDKNISRIVIGYKKIYTQAINTLNTALKTIIELVQQINKTKKYIPQYITELLSVDIVNIANKELLEEIHTQLTNYLDK
jgi:hypothetical protein